MCVERACASYPPTIQASSRNNSLRPTPFAHLLLNHYNPLPTTANLLLHGTTTRPVIVIGTLSTTIGTKDHHRKAEANE